LDSSVAAVLQLLGLELGFMGMRAEGGLPVVGGFRLAEVVPQPPLQTQTQEVLVGPGGTLLFSDNWYSFTSVLTVPAPASGRLVMP
jgi:hypothetical protein